jgi:hypothetical protein
MDEDFLRWIQQNCVISTEAEWLKLNAELDRLRREMEKAEAREQRVQRALAFWHPGVRIDDVPEAATERAADDAMLLFGLDEADEQSAVDLGWIAWVVPGEFAALRRELAEAQRERDERMRWIRELWEACEVNGCLPDSGVADEIRTAMIADAAMPAP